MMAHEEETKINDTQKIYNYKVALDWVVEQWLNEVKLRQGFEEQLRLKNDPLRNRD